MYSVLSYGQMACDGVRIDAYARAIQKAVRPGDVVVDLGCGTGIMSLLALRAGAKRVHAVDMDTSVWLSRELAKENGFESQLEVHHGSSFDLELPERADVVIADLRGSFPLFQQNIATMEDARTRLLKPDGVLMPVKDRLFVAVIEAEALRRELEQGWVGIERQGFKASAARFSTLNCAYADGDAPIRSSQLLSEAKVWGEIDYGKPFPKSISATVELPITRGGTADALAMWFEATVHEGLVYSNAPGQQLVYKRTVLPLLEPVRVEAGGSARVTLRTDVSGEQWAWDTEIGGAKRTRQAAFLGLPTSPRALLRESLANIPSRSPSGDRAARLLALMDGARTTQEVVEALEQEQPALRHEAIVDEVKSCVRRYAG